MDSLAVMAQIINANSIGVWFGVGSGLGLTGIVGKIVWSWLSNPSKTCKYHNDMHKAIIETKNDVGWIKDYLMGK